MITSKYFIAAGVGMVHVKRFHRLNMKSSIFNDLKVSILSVEIQKIQFLPA